MADIVLRPWRKEDAQPLAAIANNRNVWLNVRDRFPHPYTVMDAIQWIQLESTKQPLLNFCIEFKGKVAGSIGVMLKEDVYRKTIEIGYFVGEPFWRKGIATGSVKLLLEYIQSTFNVVRVFAEVFAHNKTSMKVLQNNGFHLEGIRKHAVIKDGVIMDDYVWVRLLHQ